MVWEEISVYSRSFFHFQIPIPIQVLHCHILICQAYLHSTLILLHKTAYLVLHSLVHGYTAILNTHLKREDADDAKNGREGRELHTTKKRRARGQMLWLPFKLPRAKLIPMEPA